MIEQAIILSEVRLDGDTQPREAIDWKLVDDYAKAIARHDRLPPIVVFDDGASKWLADGFHRFYAAKQEGWSSFPTDLREGSLEKAKMWAAHANSAHGLRRTEGDKKRAVLLALSTEEGREFLKNKGRHNKGQNELARWCGVSAAFCSEVVDEWQSAQSFGTERKNNPQPSPQDSKYATKQTKQEAVEEELEKDSDRTERDIAEAAGCTPGYVNQVKKKRAAKPDKQPPTAQATTPEPTKAPVPTAAQQAQHIKNASPSTRAICAARDILKGCSKEEKATFGRLVVVWLENEGVQ